MEHKEFDVVIIGGGTGGIMTAAQLIKKNKTISIAIIDGTKTHHYQAAYTLVASGNFKMQNLIKDEKNLIPNGVEWIQSFVSELQPEKNAFLTTNHKKIFYKYLVLSPGIKINTNKLPGLTEALNNNNVTSVYTEPEKMWEKVQNFKGGRTIFSVPNTPIKCGGAPMKVMFMSEDYWKKNNINHSIIFPTPGGVIFGVPGFKERLEQIVENKHISPFFKHVVSKIDSKNNRIYYKVAKENQSYSEEIIKHYEIKFNNDEEVSFKYDFLHIPPPQEGPDFIRNSTISHQEGPQKGWIELDPYSLQTKKHPNIFGMGDAAALPTAKTGAAIRKQVPIVVNNILQLLTHNKLGNLKYNGYSSCPIITEKGKMLLAEFNYNNVPAPDPLISKFIDTTKENWWMWILKKYGLPFLYWKFMMKGKM